jgi:hypothetical protein
LPFPSHPFAKQKTTGFPLKTCGNNGDGGATLGEKA